MLSGSEFRLSPLYERSGVRLVLCFVINTRKLIFPVNDGPFLSEVVLLRNRVASYEIFPFCLPSVSSLTTLEFHPSVTFFVGENGSGKSTLLEAIAVCLGLNPEGGSLNFNFATRSSDYRLADYLRLRRGTTRPKDCWFLRAESFFNVASEIERLDAEGGGGRRIIDSYGGVSLHNQSHGESFLSLFRNRFSNKGLYLLDEPEAALSPMRQLGFLKIMRDLIDQGSQFIIATHSPIIMAYPESWIYEFGDRQIARIAYSDTEHFRVSKLFLDDPARIMAKLFDRYDDAS